MKTAPRPAEQSRPRKADSSTASPTETPREAPHIDHDSLCQLLGVLLKLSGYIEREDDPHKRVELYGLANQLGDVLTGFTRTPKGAA